MSVDSESIESQFNIKARNSNGEWSYEFESFRLDVSRLMLYREEVEIDLAPKVVETLLVLIEKRGTIVSKEEIFERVWKDSFVDESNLTQNIYLLRKTLGAASDGQPFIETFRRRGYRFNGEVKQIGSAREIAELDVIPVSDRNKLPLVTALAATVILLGASIGWFVYTRWDSPELPATLPVQNISFQRLTPHQYIFSPAISPDGKFVAYCLVESSGPSLWIKELSSGNATQLLPSVNKGYRSLHFSPDGKQLFFLDKDNMLAVVPVSGGASRTLVSEVVNPFTLSPDGTQAAFVRGRGLAIANLDGSGERVLSERDGGSKWYSSLTSHPSWSPDGQRIVISGGRIEQGQKFSELVEIAVESGSERIISTPRWDSINNVAWLRNSKGLFVTARERITAPSQIWMVSYPDGAVSHITNDLQSYTSLSVSADSQMLVTEKTVGACNLWIGSMDNVASLKQLTFDDSEVTGRSGLTLAPEGTVIFAAEYSGNLDLWRINSDGTGLKQLTANAGDWNGRQQVSQDGRYIVFVSRRGGGQRSIWRIDADGGNSLQLTAGGQDYPAISPDGSWVYFTDLLGESPAIYRVSIDGGARERVSGDYPASLPAVSPDGQKLAFIEVGGAGGADSGKIGVLEIGSAGPPRLFEPSAFRGILKWNRDGTSLIFIQKGSPNLWQQPVSGEPSTQITNFGIETTWNFAISSDTREIVLSRGNSSAEAVLITSFN